MIRDILGKVGNVFYFQGPVQFNYGCHTFIGENYYNHTSMINEYELTLFVREDEEASLYRKYQESHFQKAYTLREMRGLLEKAGLKFVAAYDAYTKKAPMYTSERITVIAREYGK